MNRRTPIGAILLLLALLLAACGGGPAPAEPEPSATEEAPAAANDTGTAEVVTPGAYAEAPMLAEQVSAGELPPVDERLPANPIVITPVESVGQYGGTWNRVDNDTLGWLRQVVWVEPYVKLARDLNGIRPNVVESWEWNEDATQLILNFREGMRWSDGEPFTTNDFMFWWNDLVLNEEIPVTAPGYASAGGELMTVEQIDDYTIQLSFAAPNPLFLELAARGHYNSAQHLVPAHYLQQFHPAYADVEETDELMNRFNTSSRLHYTDMPTIWAWRTVEYQSGQIIRMERNPYYWKVDTAGNQLPYIDRIESEIAEGNATEQVVLKAISGEIDMQVRDVPLQDISLVLENAEANDYRVMMWNRGDFAWPWLMLMYDYPDEAIVDLMYNQSYRQALSYAINRARINDIVSLGLAQPRQFALSAEGPEFQSPEGQAFYNEWVASYADYDPERAMALLDEIGMVDVDGDEFRERPDGEPFELLVDVVASDQTSVDAVDLIKEDWDAIGINTVINATTGEAIDERSAAGEVMLRAWGSAAAWGLLSASTVWTPIEGFPWSMSQRIGLYYQTNGEEGIPPRSGSMLEQLQESYTAIVQTADPEERNAMLLEAYQIHIDEGPINIGTIGEHPSPVIVANNFFNVPETGLVASWDLGFPGTADPEQFWIDE